MVKIEKLEKILVAGPTLVNRARDADALKDSIWHKLGGIAYQRMHIGVIAAEDTITGRFARQWADSRALPFYGHRAFDSPGSRLAEMLLSERARQLVTVRNRVMMADRNLRLALLYIQTNECADLIDGLRDHPKKIEIMRVCA